MPERPSSVPLQAAALGHPWPGGLHTGGSWPGLGKVDQEKRAAQALGMRGFCLGRKFLGIGVWSRQREEDLGEQVP